MGGNRNVRGIDYEILEGERGGRDSYNGLISEQSNEGDEGGWREGIFEG